MGVRRTGQGRRSSIMLVLESGFFRGFWCVFGFVRLIAEGDSARLLGWVFWVESSLLITVWSASWAID